MGFFSALMNKPTQQPSNVQSATSGQPVPVATIITPPSKLTSDAALNQAAVGAWPTMLDAGIKVDTSWRPSVLREVSTHNVIGNYGSVTSMARFGFTWREFAGVGNYPGPVPNAFRPTYNYLEPITWDQRVPNNSVTPAMSRQTGPISVQQKSSTWLGVNTASLNNTGQVLL
jgi:hypothetical protein